MLPSPTAVSSITDVGPHIASAALALALGDCGMSTPPCFASRTSLWKASPDSSSVNSSSTSAWESPATRRLAVRAVSSVALAGGNHPRRLPNAMGKHFGLSNAERFGTGRNDFGRRGGHARPSALAAPAHVSDDDIVVGTENVEENRASSPRTHTREE